MKNTNQSKVATLGVSVLSISQATRATFTDLYLQNALVVFIQVGSKRVLCPINGELIGRPEDVMVFPPGSIVTIENRPIHGEAYRATGICFSQSTIAAVFSSQNAKSESGGISVLQACPGQALQIVETIRATLNDIKMPAPIKQHRLLEPLVWLKHNGIHLSPYEEEKPVSKVRRLIETDLSYPWRSSEVAGHLAVSEATMRRWLTKSGQGFSRLLQNIRLEHGLSLLQSTDMPISAIALSCGFKTPSHFSDSFKKRFEIRPSEIRKLEN